MKLRVLENFAGIGTQRMALDNLGIEHEVVGITEIDKFAIKSYEAIHGEVNNLGDISLVDPNDVPDHDLFTYSFPCQDISVAGKGKGFEKGSGTRSGLLWECEKVIRAKKPKYLLMENVKNLVAKKFKPGFEEWLTALEELGYTNYWQVLNAKDYGIPQNRERVFCVSILGEHEPYEFPEKETLELRLKDILEHEVDEKFYLDNEKAKQLIATVSDKYDIKETTPTDGGLKEPKPKEVANTILARYDAGISNQQSTGTMVIEPKVINPLKGKTNNGWHFEQQVYDSNGIARAVKAGGGSGNIPKVIEPKAERIGGIFDKDGERHQAGAVWDKEQLAPTLDTMQGGWRQPSVLIKNNTKLGYVEATDGAVELPTIGASRGRNPKNPSDRTVGSPTEQRLEINKQGTSNTITTVQKDNYVVEAKGRTGYIGENETYTIEVLRTLQKEIGKEAYAEWEDRGLRVLREKEILRQGLYEERLDVEENRKTQECKVKSTECENEGGVFYRDQGVSEVFVDEKSRRSSHKSGSYEQFARELGSFMQELSYEESSQEESLSDLWRTAEGVGSVQQALHQIQKVWRPELYKIPSFRIRKLSPLECWRLMGISDDDFEKAQEVNSNTQLYKQAGNAIVVDVLEAIFANMFK